MLGAAVVGVAVTVTVDVLGGAVVGGAVVAASVVAASVVGPPVAVVRVGVGKLLRMLLAVLPHPAVMHAETRIAAERERLLSGRRISILRVVPWTRASRQ